MLIVHAITISMRTKSLSSDLSMLYLFLYIYMAINTLALT